MSQNLPKGTVFQTQVKEAIEDQLMKSSLIDKNDNELVVLLECDLQIQTIIHKDTEIFPICSDENSQKKKSLRLIDGNSIKKI